ncbi:hypothetical protein ES705_32626 [subsurface metagenome]
MKRKTIEIQDICNSKVLSMFKQTSNLSSGVRLFNLSLELLSSTFICFKESINSCTEFSFGKYFFRLSNL